MAGLDIAAIGISKDGILGGGIVFIVVVVVGLIALGILWLMMYMSKFNVVVSVEERRGNSIVEYITRGGIFVNRKSKVKEFVVWRGKWQWNSPLRGAVPENSFFRMTSRGRRILRIFKDNIDTYKVLPPQKKTFYDRIFGKTNNIIPPIKPGTPTHPDFIPVPNIEFKELEKPVDLDWMNWATQTLRGYAPRFRNDTGFLKENAGLVGLFGVIFLMTVFVIVGFQKWEDGSGNLAAAAASNAVATQKIVDANLQMVGIQTIQPQTNPPPNTPNNQQVIKSLSSGVTG